MPLQAHGEGLRVARLLAKKIEAKDLSVRRVEELVGWGQKTLQQVLNGEQPIRISHVAAVLAILRLDVSDFYRELAGDDQRPHKRQAGGSAQKSRVTPRARQTDESRLKVVSNHRLVRALLEQCRSLRFSDPERMILAATLAVALAERTEMTPEAAAEQADLQARAWAELGNAYRVADDLASAEHALARALDLAQHGTGDPLVLARLMDLTASLYTDQHRFEEAHRLLDWVATVYWHLGDRHLAARALISKGISVGLAFDSEEAVALLQRGIPLLDSARDPKLTLAAIHALLWCLVDCGQADKVAGLLGEIRELYAVQGEPLLNLRALWLEGRVAAGLGEDTRAEQAFLRVREGFHEAELPYTAAMASIDLAAVWLRQGRTAEIAELVDEMVAIFRSRNIQREAIAALLMLREALQKKQLTAALLQSVTTELRRLERFGD